MTPQCVVATLLEADEEIDPRQYLRDLTKRDIRTHGRLILVGPNPQDSGNPIVRCPMCSHEGPLMDQFSYLAAGFNGIEPGDDDDLDVQECGNCGAKLEWDHIPVDVSESGPDDVSAKDYLIKVSDDLVDETVRQVKALDRHQLERFRLPVFKGLAELKGTFNGRRFVYSITTDVPWRGSEVLVNRTATDRPRLISGIEQTLRNRLPWFYAAERGARLYAAMEVLDKDPRWGAFLERANTDNLPTDYMEQTPESEAAWLEVLKRFKREVLEQP